MDSSRNSVLCTTLSCLCRHISSVTLSGVGRASEAIAFKQRHTHTGRYASAAAQIIYHFVKLLNYVICNKCLEEAKNIIMMCWWKFIYITEEPINNAVLWHLFKTTCSNLPIRLISNWICIFPLASIVLFFSAYRIVIEQEKMQRNLKKDLHGDSDMLDPEMTSCKTL